MSEPHPDFMQSLARGLQVLEAFWELGAGQSIASLSTHTDLPRGVIARCLYTLSELGYVGRRERLYHVLPGVLRLADAFLSDRSLSALAQPVLEGLHDELDESCSLAVLDGAEILYVARASRSRIMSIGLHVGSRLPAWVTSMGRVLLASLAPAERDTLLPQEPLPRLTPLTLVDRAALEKVLEGVVGNGYAIVDQELEIGLRSIAVPVCNEAGCTIGALNVGTNALERSLQDLEKTILPALTRAASSLGRQAHLSG